jgi:hypothetical protein
MVGKAKRRPKKRSWRYYVISSHDSHRDHSVVFFCHIDMDVCVQSGRTKFEKKWRSVLAYHGPSKFNWMEKNEKWLRDHDDVFNHATRSILSLYIYSIRVSTHTYI